MPSAREDWLAPGFDRPVCGLSAMLQPPSIRLLRGKSELVFNLSKLEPTSGEEPTTVPEVASVGPYCEDDCSWTYLIFYACYRR